jgi:hypothetical protein
VFGIASQLASGKFRLSKGALGSILLEACPSPGRESMPGGAARSEREGARPGAWPGRGHRVNSAGTGARGSLPSARRPGEPPHHCLLDKAGSSRPGTKILPCPGRGTSTTPSCPVSQQSPRQPRPGSSLRAAKDGGRSCRVMDLT